MNDLVPAQPGWWTVPAGDEPPRPVLAWRVIGRNGLQAVVPPRHLGDEVIFEGLFDYHPEWAAPWTPRQYQAMTEKLPALPHRQHPEVPATA